MNRGKYNNFFFSFLFNKKIIGKIITKKKSDDLVKNNMNKIKPMYKNLQLCWENKSINNKGKKNLV